MLKNSKQSLIKVLILILALVLLLLASAFLYTKTAHYKNLEAQKYVNCGVAGCDNTNDNETVNLNTAPASQNNTYGASAYSGNSYTGTSTESNVVAGEPNMKPKINSINKTSYKYGDTVEVRGENFYALENDKIVIIENGKGEKIYLDTIWNQWHSYISFVLPSEVCSVLEGESGIADCKDRNGKMIKIEKGAYKLYYPDFGTGELSNSVNFSIE